MGVNKVQGCGLDGRSQMHNELEKLWGAAQEHLRSLLSADIYNLWFAPLRLHAVEGDQAVLEVANDFCEVWLKENYLGLLEDALAAVAGRRLSISFKVASAQSASPAEQPANKQAVEGGSYW